MFCPLENETSKPHKISACAKLRWVGRTTQAASTALTSDIHSTSISHPQPSPKPQPTRAHITIPRRQAWPHAHDPLRHPRRRIRAGQIRHLPAFSCRAQASRPPNARPGHAHSHLAQRTREHARCPAALLPRCPTAPLPCDLTSSQNSESRSSLWTSERKFQDVVRMVHVKNCHHSSFRFLGKHPSMGYPIATSFDATSSTV